MQHLLRESEFGADYKKNFEYSRKFPTLRKIFMNASDFSRPKTPRHPKKFGKKCDLIPQPLEKFLFYFIRFFLNSLEIVILQQKLKSKMQKSQIFGISLYFFRKIFSITYDCPTFFCIKVSICEEISIRYTLQSWILFGQTANP